MSDIIIWIDMETYLRQWFIHDQGGQVPVRLTKGSPDSNLLYTFLQVPPPGAPRETEREGAVPIIVPYYKYKDIRYNNYLGAHAKEQFYHEVRNRFLVELWHDLHRWGYIGKQKQELIYAWMAAHGIEDSETNYFAVQKIYQRLRSTDLQRIRREKKKKARVDENGVK